jgi:hypothetical protein
MDHQAFAQLLGNYGEFVGSIAVVATLIYLALQIRQNTDTTRRASIQMSVESSVGINSMLATNAELNDIFGKVWPILTVWTLRSSEDSFPS